MDIRTTAKSVGLSENDLKGKTLDEQINLITRKIKQEKKNLEIELAKEYIGNYEKKLPKVIEALKEPFEVYVKEVGQKKSKTVVQVVGYNPGSKSVIVFFSTKIYQIKDEDLIKSVDELKTEKPKEKTAKKTTKK
jgi:hypothetical protein